MTCTVICSFRPNTWKLTSCRTNLPECMAEMHRRPLYRVSAADLGSSVTEVERNLQLAFRRISRWNAILLLDEADILMARRGDDTDDNSLVSGEWHSYSVTENRVDLTISSVATTT